MALTQRLELKQGQTLVMTPQLQQAIKLLQLSNLELADYVETELEKNPLLEREDTHAGEGEPTPREIEGAAGIADNAPLDKTLATEDFGTASDLDAGHDDLYADESRAEKQPAGEINQPLTDWSHTGSGGNPDGEDFEGSLTADTTLKGHLEAQLAIAGLMPHQRFIAEVLIEAVDEAGYLRADLGEVAERLGTSLEDCEATLAVLQGFDPAGVFARDLVECLALQLKERDRLDPAMQLLLTRLDLVAKRDISGLSALCALDASDITDMIAEIRALTPKPGLAFGSEPVQPVVPDVYVREGADGTWHVELNSDTLPRVLVNARYYAQVNRTARNRDDKTYLTDCLNSANWLVKSLDQRARTIVKVASEIVRQQDAFLTHGVRHLRPLNLRLIADAIGMHESTVSRVTSNKYMATPRGLFELKYFFTSAIQSVNGGEAHSAEAVRDRIRELVEKEENEILSDDRIVTILSADGIEIARRTVAKYREALRIPSSVERRRQRQLEVSDAGS
ncbi:MAG TPA: RNA polymerase factor sigma-54 [Micropepsaceae bacterium]|nr:RNA polymerase factor sigma-54 [Micropepsaceae bacterium]